jgi:hypothetical protein
VAIIFTAMIVFFFVQFDVRAVREAMGEWKENNPESRVVRSLLQNFPAYTTFQRVGGLPSRFFLIIFTLGIISFPLTKSLEQVRRQVAQQRQENQLNSTIKQVWEDNFGSGDGEFQSYIDQIKAKDDNGRVTVQIQVVTDRLYSQEDEKIFMDELAAALDRNPDKISLRLVQIPTGQMVNTQNIAVTATPELTSLPDLQRELMTEINQALSSIILPEPLQLVDYQLVLRSDNSPLRLVLVYLGDRDLQKDAQTVLSDQIRRSLQLQLDDGTVQYQRLSPQQGIIPLSILDDTETVDTESPSLEISPQDWAVLDKVGQTLQSYPNISLRLTIQRPADSNPASLFSQTEQLRDYWAKNWQVAESRIQETTNVGAPPQVSLAIFVGETVPNVSVDP